MVDQMSGSSTHHDELAERILRCAEQSLEAHGEHALRVSEIVNCSGASVGSIYNIYGSKEGLIRAARERQYLQRVRVDHENVKAMIDSATTVDELIERLLTMVRVIASSERTPMRLKRVEMIGSSVSRPELFDVVRSIQTELADAGEEVASELERRGWLADGVTPRSFSLFIQALAIGQVLNDLDLHAVPTDTVVHTVELSVRGLLRSPE